MMMMIKIIKTNFPMTMKKKKRLIKDVCRTLLSIQETVVGMVVGSSLHMLCCSLATTMIQYTSPFILLMRISHPQ